MAETMNLKELEKRAYASSFQDGLWDIFLGVLLFAMFSELFFSSIGASWGYIIPEPMGNLSVSQVVLSALALLVLFAGKRLVTVPRMRVARFGPRRRARLWKIGAVFVATLILGLAFAWGIAPSELSIGMPLPLVAWIVVSVSGFGLAAYLLDFIRLYLYAALFAASPVSFVLLKQVGFLTVGLLVVAASSAIMIAAGIILLLCFLRKYPRPLEMQ
jgi:MFS family permease